MYTYLKKLRKAHLSSNVYFTIDIGMTSYHYPSTLNEIRSKAGTGNQVVSFFTFMVDYSSIIALDSNNRL